MLTLIKKSSLIVALLLLSCVSFAETQPLSLKAFELIDVSTNTGKIFRNLLQKDLARHFEIVNQDSPKQKHVLSGALSRLGEKIIVEVEIHDEDSQQLIFSDRANVYREEELDVVSRRFAKSIIEQIPFEQSVNYQSVIEEETRNRSLKNSLAGLSVELGNFKPLGTQNYGRGESGISVFFGGIIEKEDFFYHPMIGYRKGEKHHYTEVPIDISIGKFFSDSGFTTFVSTGVGLRYLDEEITVKESVGGVVQRLVNQTFDKSEWGLGAHLKVGAVFFREYDHRLMLSLRYDLSSTDPFDRGNYESISVQLGMLAF